MRLYHFTNLISLPEIMREGITLGEVPVASDKPYCDRPKAANLTRINDPKENQTVWCYDGPTNKVVIRLTVDVPTDRLTTFEEIAEKYKISSDWLEKLAPSSHRKQWYFAFDGVKPSEIIKIERLVNGKYVVLDKASLKTLIEAIERERALKFNFGVIESGLNKGALFRAWKPGHSTSWLNDGNED